MSGYSKSARMKNNEMSNNDKLTHIMIQNEPLRQIKIAFNSQEDVSSCETKDCRSKHNSFNCSDITKEEQMFALPCKA